LRFEFIDNDLEELYTKGSKAKLARKLPSEAVKGFSKVMTVIKNAKDERDFRALKGLGYHPLKRERKGQHAFDLNDQWRLAVKWQEDKQGDYLLILEIVDYH
jgi:plasmid maintenance system killer protein